MNEQVSRRSLAAGAAGLAAAGLAPDLASARRRKKHLSVHIVPEGLVTLDGNRLTVERVVHAIHVRHDGRGMDRVADHARLLPPAGGQFDYHVAGIEQRDGERTGASGISTLFTFRATGGVYDADTGQLVLDGEVIAMNRGGVDEDARLIWLLALIFVALGIGGAVQLGEYLSGN